MSRVNLNFKHDPQKYVLTLYLHAVASMLNKYVLHTAEI